MHSLLVREIVVDGVGESELYFAVGGRRFKLSKYEFCLLTRLKFGGRAIFQRITTVLSKVVSFRGIGQMGKLMW